MTASVSDTMAANLALNSGMTVCILAESMMDSCHLRACHPTKTVSVPMLIGFLLVVAAIGLRAGNASVLEIED